MTIAQKDEVPIDFDHYKFAREILTKEIEYRREKQWKIFSWTNSILIGITGGIIAISGKGFVLSPYQIALLISSVFILTLYTCIWVNENWKKENNAKKQADLYDKKIRKFDLPLVNFSERTKFGFGYIPTIVMLAIAATLAILLAPQSPPPNKALDRSAASEFRMVTSVLCAAPGQLGR
jgi:carbon starvation protein CstA